jgi:hypothetical protein
MTPVPTSASLSSYPVGLFYSNPALTDGGQSSVRNLLSKLPAGATLAGFFELSA